MNAQRKEELLKLLIEFYKDTVPANEHYEGSVIRKRIDSLIGELLGEEDYEQLEEEASKVEVPEKPEPLSKSDSDYLDDLFGPSKEKEQSEGAHSFTEASKVEVLVVPEKQETEIGIDLASSLDEEPSIFEQEFPKSLTLDNFWNGLQELYPDSMKAFCTWIDKYKERIGWPHLLGSAIKYHDLPIAMQIGIFLQFSLEYKKTDFLFSDALDMNVVVKLMREYLEYDQNEIECKRDNPEMFDSKKDPAIVSTNEDISFF